MRALLVGGLCCSLASTAADGAEPSISRVDLHSHVTMRRAAQPLFRGEPGVGSLAGHGWNFWTNQVDVAGLRAAGIRVVVVALWPPFRLRPGRTALHEALHQLDELRAFVRARPDFALASSAADVTRILKTDQIALWAAIEGGEGIESLADLDALYAAGARSLTLVHFADSALGGAMRMPNARVLGIPPDTRDYRGLSAFGEQVVRRMIDLGMVIDLAHATEQLAHQVLAITEAEGVPAVLSHTNPWALAPFEPNVSDPLASRVARGGGMIGVLAQIIWIGRLPEAARGPAHVLGTCDDTLSLWQHLERVAGARAVALGSDFNGFIVRPRPGGACPHGLVNARALEGFFEVLRARSPEPAAVDRSADAWLELVRKVELRASPAKQREAQRRPVRVPGAFDIPF